MADRLLRDFVLDHGGISHALSTHLLGRHREGRPGLRDPTASFWAGMTLAVPGATGFVALAHRAVKHESESP